jgi:hypothetical protein
MNLRFGVSGPIRRETSEITGAVSRAVFILDSYYVGAHQSREERNPSIAPTE